MSSFLPRNIDKIMHYSTKPNLELVFYRMITWFFPFCVLYCKFQPTSVPFNTWVNGTLYQTCPLHTPQITLNQLEQSSNITQGH